MQYLKNVPSKKRRGSNCLIIEDSTFDQQMMTRVMTRSFGNVHVDVASTLADARAQLADNTISLILLDNNLPDGFGADFAMELANDPELSRIPVIMVSDWPSPFMWEKAQAAGVLFVVSKSEFGARFVKSALANRAAPAGVN
ncbi:MAG: response regulator [Sulfitobacter sp.]